jgi:hypothetical protein
MPPPAKTIGNLLFPLQPKMTMFYAKFKKFSLAMPVSRTGVNSRGQNHAREIAKYKL